MTVRLGLLSTARINGAVPGCYRVRAAWLVAGREPDRVRAECARAPTGVDERFAAVLRGQARSLDELLLAVSA